MGFVAVGVCLGCGSGFFSSLGGGFFCSSSAASSSGFLVNSSSIIFFLLLTLSFNTFFCSGFKLGSFSTNCNNFDSHAYCSFIFFLYVSKSHAPSWMVEVIKLIS